MALVPRRVLGLWALTVVARPGIGFPGSAAVSGRELYFTLSAHCVAVRRLRRSHTCRVWTWSSRPEYVARGGRSLSYRRRCVRLPLLGFQRCPSVGISPLRPVPVRGVVRRSSPSAREMPLSPAPSVRAVPPGFDGLLRCVPRRLCTVRGVRVIADSLPRGCRSCNRPWGSCRFGACCLSACLSIRPGASRRQSRKNREFAGRVCRRVPGHALPFEAFPSAAAVPSSPTGDFLLAVAGRCAGQGRDCESRVLAPLAAADLKALLRCRSSGAESLLPALLSRCSPGLDPGAGGWKMLPRKLSGQAAQSRDRNRSPGRTRVHPVYRPRSDLDDGATGPRLIRRIR